MENWAFEPEVLKVYARHYKTGEVIPTALVEKIQASRQFNQGFATTEYLAASLLDMDWHTLAAATAPDTAAFERIALARMGMPREIVPRYRSTYFQHIFGPGGGYSSGYYSYIWAEVLDADAFEAFKEKGLFDQATATLVPHQHPGEGRQRGRDDAVRPLPRQGAVGRAAARQARFAVGEGLAPPSRETWVVVGEGLPLPLEKRGLG